MHPPRSLWRPRRAAGNRGAAMPAFARYSDGDSATQAMLSCGQAPAYAMSPPVWNSAQAVNSAHAAISASKLFMMSVLSLEVCPIFEARLPKVCTIQSVLLRACGVPIVRRYLDERLRKAGGTTNDPKADADAHPARALALSMSSISSSIPSGSIPRRRTAGPSSCRPTSIWRSAAATNAFRSAGPGGTGSAECRRATCTRRAIRC